MDEATKGPNSMGTVDLAMPVVVSDQVMARVVQGESVLLDLRTEQYLGLDEVGTRMWQLMLDGGSPEAAVGPMLAEYDVEEAALRADLAVFVRTLLDKRLIEVPGAAGP